MFPFVPVDSQTGDVDVFGNPIHGLYEFIYGDPVAEEVGGIIPGDGKERSRVTTFVLDITHNPVLVLRNHFSWSSTSSSRIYDTGALFTRDPDLEDYDQINGNEWRETAIINANDVYHRNNAIPNFNGWLYSAPDGTTWSINASMKVTAPDNVEVFAKVRRWGVMKFANSLWGILDEPDEEFDDTTDTVYTAQASAGISDFSSIDSSGGDPTNGFPLDFNKDGSQGLWAIGRIPNRLYAQFNHVVLGAPQNVRKSVASIGRLGNNGIQVNVCYLVTLSGTPNSDIDPFSISIAIHRDQAACAGTLATNKNERVSSGRVWGGGYGGTGGTCVFIRPNLIVDPGGFSGDFIFSTQLGSTAPPHPAEAAFCGWDRLDGFGGSHLDGPLGDTGEESFRWWVSAPPSPQATGEVWEASQEYSVGNRVAYQGFVFTALIAHTSDADFVPGVTLLWPERWEFEHKDGVYDIDDAPQWAEGTSYSTFDVVHNGVGDYFISKGAHSSFTSGADPEEFDFSQPLVGSVWERFWDGPHNVLLSGAVWLENRLMVKDWIIPQSYTEPRFSESGSSAEIEDATWKVIRPHVSAPENKPGSGARWEQFWEQAVEFPASFGTPWIPPIRYGGGLPLPNEDSRGNRVNIGSDPNTVYTTTRSHIASAVTKPPSDDWEEDVTIIDHTDPLNIPFGGVSNLSPVAYHVDTHDIFTESMDFKIEGIFAYSHFRDNGSIKNYTVNAQYTRERIDDVFDHFWTTNGNTLECESPGNFWDGSITRGPASVTETILYEFFVDGAERQSIFLRAIATAQGSDVWTENFDSLTAGGWEASGSYTLDIFNDGLTHASISESVGIGNTLPGGVAPRFRDDPLPGKGDWSTQNFCSGWTFRFIDTPHMDQARVFFENAAARDLPGVGLLHFPGPGVNLEAISGVSDEQFESRPLKTSEQDALGQPFPSIYFVVYSPKLVGPLVIGRKGHATGTDIQYLNVAEPPDFPWTQYGIYGPDAEQDTIIRLTERSPTVGLITWLQNADYGDDISSCYDPVTQKIERNNQYKVVYL